MKRKTILLLCVVLAAASCTDMFDNVREYAAEETIYTNRLDGILRTYIGFERVEFDLMQAGRIPASRMNLGRAVRTVIECEDFTEEGHRRVIDTLCSWVNITGLTQFKTYQFTIYTEDANGNRSLPLTAEARPFTRENLSSLSLATPSVVESDAAALLEWKDHLSTVNYTINGWSSTYTDKDGVEHRDGADGDLPSFFVENVDRDVTIPVTMTCRTIPMTTNDDGTYTPILDEVEWTSVVPLRISPDARPAIFLKSPQPAFTVDSDEYAEVFPLTFTWIKVAAAGAGYTLKFSDRSEFPAASTVTVDVGDVSEWTMDEAFIRSLVSRYNAVRARDLYWSVVPTGSVSGVTVQNRKFTVTRQPHVVARYLFDGSDWTAAAVGRPLSVYNGEIFPDDGPTATDGAVSIAQGSWLGIPHDLDGNRSFTVMVRVRWNQRSVPHSLIQLNKANNDRAEVLVSGTCGLSIDGLASTPGAGNISLGPDTWHRIFLVGDAGTLTLWVDGWKACTGSSTAARYALNGDEILIGADSNGADNAFSISEAAVWDFPLTEDEMLSSIGVRKIKVTPVSTNDNSSNNLSHVNDGSLTTAPWSTSQLPGWFILDMGEIRTIGKVLAVRHVWNGGGCKTVQFSVGDNLQDHANWTPMWSFSRGGAQWNIYGTFYSGEFPEESYTGRYLKLTFPDNWVNGLTEMTEVVVYEKE